MLLSTGGQWGHCRDCPLAQCGEGRGLGACGDRGGGGGSGEEEGAVARVQYPYPMSPEPSAMGRCWTTCVQRGDCTQMLCVPGLCVSQVTWKQWSGGPGVGAPELQAGARPAGQEEDSTGTPGGGALGTQERPLGTGWLSRATEERARGTEGWAGRSAFFVSLYVCV